MDYTGVLNFTASIPANHENASRVSADPRVQELVDQTRSYQERLAHSRGTYAWNRIISETFARSSKGTFVRGGITAE